MHDISTVTKNPLKTELDFTRVYRENHDVHIALRELRCLEILFPSIFQPFQAGDHFAGRVKYPLCGFSPQPGGYGYYCHENAIRRILAEGGDASWCRQVEEMLFFWKDNTSTSKTRSAYPEWVANTLPTDQLEVISAAYPLYRMSGTQLDYGKILKLGISGMKQEVTRNFDLDSESPLCQALLGALNLVEDIAGRYVWLLRNEKQDFLSDKERDVMTHSLEFIPKRAPETFREAAQLLWLVSLSANSWNYGRMDVVLGSFLARDIAQKTIDEETAIDLLCSLWKLMHSLDAKYDNRVIVGGRGRENEQDADVFALLAMEASRRLNINQPQLTLRFYEGQNPALLSKAYDVLGEGITFPLLYNDDVNIPAVARSMDIPLAEATDYLPFGCGEYMIWKRGIATPSGAISLAKCLEFALNDGKCLLSGAFSGVHSGDSTAFNSFEELWHAYTSQVEHQIKALAQQQKIEYEVAGREAPFLYFTLLSEDCLSRKKAMFDGGIRYLSGTLETYGNIDVSDSLTAIRMAVFEEKSISMHDLLKALERNWGDAKAMQSYLLSLPKYGNDNIEADKMAIRVHEHVCNFTRAQAKVVGLDYYLVVIINNSMNVDLGRMTAALPDGRMAKAPLANGNNPVAGRDRQGVTAFLQSLLKLTPDNHAGASQNMKFSKSMFSKNQSIMESLLQTYWKNGGAQAMITVVNRGDLEAALNEPEKWGHLMVRVGGFSEHFVKLSHDMQLHIMDRTLND